MRNIRYIFTVLVIILSSYSSIIGAENEIVGRYKSVGAGSNYEIVIREDGTLTVSAGRGKDVKGRWELNDYHLLRVNSILQPIPEDEAMVEEWGEDIEYMKIIVRDRDGAAIPQALVFYRCDDKDNSRNTNNKGEVDCRCKADSVAVSFPAAQPVQYSIKDSNTNTLIITLQFEPFYITNELWRYDNNRLYISKDVYVERICEE